MYVQDHQSLVSYRDNLAAHSMLCTDFHPIRSFVCVPLNLPLTCFIERYTGQLLVLDEIWQLTLLIP